MLTAPPIDLLTLQETAELLRHSEASVRDLVASGVIPAIRLRRKLLFSRRAVLAALERAAVVAPALPFRRPPIAPLGFIPDRPA